MTESAVVWTSVDDSHSAGKSLGEQISFQLKQNPPDVLILFVSPKYDAPTLLRAVILAEPGGALDESLGGKPDAAGQASAFTAAADLVAAGDEEGGLKVVAEHTGGPGAWERRPEERKAISRANARTMLGQRKEERRPYSRATAATIRMPTLFVYGADTRPNFVANVEALSGAIAGSKVEVISNATHGLPYENPTDFNEAVVRFLQARRA